MMNSYGFEDRLASWRTLLQESPEPFMEYLIKGELGVQQQTKRVTMLKEFWQHDMSLWNSDSLIFLSERDKYVNCEAVIGFVERFSFGSQIAVGKGWPHGGIVLPLLADHSAAWNIIKGFLKGNRWHGVKML